MRRYRSPDNSFGRAGILSRLFVAKGLPTYGKIFFCKAIVGGEQEGPPERGALGKTLVAVELKSSKGYGRCRLRLVPDAGAESLLETPFVLFGRM